MYPTEWAGRHVETLARHHRLVWVEDPYRLITPEEVQTIQARLELLQIPVMVVDNAWALRKCLNPRSPIVARMVLIDQSYRLREPHLAPTDAKPSDLVPLRAPDWKALVDAEARFRPTIRDFLVYATEDTCWPAEVNIFPYEELARTDPEGFVAAFESYRDTGKTLTSQDLVLVGASAALEIDLVSLSDPMLALELAFHGNEKWHRLGQFFNTSEIEEIRKRLASLPSPLGDLFGPGAEAARQAIVALIILSQHFQLSDFEQPGQHLPILSPALATYADCPAMQVSEAPSWFIAEEVPRFEHLLTKQFAHYLYRKLSLDNPDNAKQFWERERFSPKLRQLAAESVVHPSTVGPEILEGEFSLSMLIPQFREATRTLDQVVRSTKQSVDRIRLTPPKEVALEQLMKAYEQTGAYRIESILGILNRLIADIEGPARREWDFVPDFKLRWNADVQACRDLMNRASRVRDDLDFEFGRLLESRYSEFVPTQALSTGFFYDRFIGPRRRTTDGKIKSALILVIDSMRLDIWRQIVRPSLEQDYEMEEVLALAELPSETVVSRTCFFAGKRPGEIRPGMKETDLLAEVLQRFHGQATTFVESPVKRSGMRYLVRSADGRTSAGVFDFPDVLSHRADWDRNMIDEALKPFVREVRALLKEVGPETLVFITADHGHYRRDGGSPVFLEGTDDVGYRSAWLPERIEGEQARKLFQIPARAIGHEKLGYYVFPRPGFHLRSRDIHNTPGRSGASYRHGGISMAEVVVPLIFLRHRLAPVRIRLSVNLRESVVVGKPAAIHVSVSADGKLDSPVRLAADTPDVESLMIPGAATTPETYTLKFLASSPGRRQLRVQAWLRDNLMTEALLDFDVAPAAVQEDEAKLKLRKIWGDD